MLLYGLGPAHLGDRQEHHARDYDRGQQSYHRGEWQGQCHPDPCAGGRFDAVVIKIFDLSAKHFSQNTAKRQPQRPRSEKKRGLWLTKNE
jgi:hypothetical protein